MEKQESLSQNYSKTSAFKNYDILLLNTELSAD